MRGRVVPVSGHNMTKLIYYYQIILCCCDDAHFSGRVLGQFRILIVRHMLSHVVDIHISIPETEGKFQVV